MNLGHYAYLSLTLRPDEPNSVDVSFHTADLWIRTSVIKDVRPYLSIGTPEATVTISTTGAGPVTDADLATARQLAHTAARYLADCERLHASQAATSTVISDETATLKASSDEAA